MIEIILILLFAQSLYDFIIWYGLYKEKKGHSLEFIFRWGKFIIDFPVTSYFFWGVALLPFYILKWAGWADALYMFYWWVLNRKPYWSENGKPKDVYWLWWTILGLYRTIGAILMYKNEYGWGETVKEFSKPDTILKARITRNEFIGQLIVSIPLAFIILLIFYYIRNYIANI